MSSFGLLLHILRNFAVAHSHQKITDIFIMTDYYNIIMTDYCLDIFFVYLFEKSFKTLTYNIYIMLIVILRLVTRGFEDSSVGANILLAACGPYTLCSYILLLIYFSSANNENQRSQNLNLVLF